MQEQDSLETAHAPIRLPSSLKIDTSSNHTQHLSLRSCVTSHPQNTLNKKSQNFHSSFTQSLIHSYSPTHFFVSQHSCIISMCVPGIVPEVFVEFIISAINWLNPAPIQSGKDGTLVKERSRY